MRREEVCFMGEETVTLTQVGPSGEDASATRQGETEGLKMVITVQQGL